MMIIKANELTKTPWKNGGGQTTEILRVPANALDYNYRVSYAEVASDGPFSKFDGYDRALIVWQGKGLVLNGEKLLPLVPHFFSGETAIDAQLIDGAVTDLGCIYRRESHTCQMNVVNEITEPAIYFVLSGEVKTNEGTAQARDTFVFDGRVHREVSADFQAVAIAVRRRAR